MKRFIKIWVRETIQLFLIFFGVIYWLDSFGIIGYLGITLWSLFWLAGIITLVEYKKK